MRRVIILAAITLFLVLGLVWYLQRAHTAILTISAGPKPASIWIDNKNYGNHQQFQIRLSRGVHLVQARLDGYQTFGQNLDVNQRQISLNINLKPVTPARYTTDNPLGVPLNSTYKLTNLAYFTNNTWAVGFVNQEGNEAAAIVFKKERAGWIIFLGPGTQFDVSKKANLPAEVFNYLKQSKLIVY